MSNFPAYTTKTFSPTQKFFVLDPNTGSPAFVQGSDLVAQLTPNSKYVYSESTRTTAQATDYKRGSVIQTSGATSVGDNRAGVYVVVAPGEGDFPMDNGDELLTLAGDDTLLERLALNTVGEGSDLVAHTGTTNTVTEAIDQNIADINQRTIYVGSVAELEALSLAVETNVYLTQDGRSGSGVIKSGSHGLDPQKGIFIDLANGNYWERSNYDFLRPEYFGAARDGSTDDYTALQATIDFCKVKNKKIVLSEGAYNISQPLNLIISTNDLVTLFIEGAGSKNTDLFLTDDLADYAVGLDHGYTYSEITDCDITSGSAVVTRASGGFLSSGLSAGARVTTGGVISSVLSVDSDTQITLNDDAILTRSGATLFCSLVGVLGNSVDLKGFAIRNTAPTVVKQSWHPGSGFYATGLTYSTLDDIRSYGFTDGFRMNRGWENNFNKCFSTRCRNGFHVTYITFRWTFYDCVTLRTGSTVGGDIGVGYKFIFGGSVSLVNPTSEIDTRDFDFQGITCLNVDGGSVEVAITDGSNISSAFEGIDDERLWCKGVTFTSLRLFNKFSFKIRDGVDGVDFRACIFYLDNPGFTPNAINWIRIFGEYDKVRNVNFDSSCSFPEGFETNVHVNDRGQLGSAQSVTKDHKRYTERQAGPFYGKYWKVGDIVHAVPGDASPTSALYWVCTTAADGSSDDTAVWRAINP